MAWQERPAGTRAFWSDLQHCFHRQLIPRNKTQATKTWNSRSPTADCLQPQTAWLPQPWRPYQSYLARLPIAIAPTQSCRRSCRYSSADAHALDPRPRPAEASHRPASQPAVPAVRGPLSPAVLHPVICCINSAFFRGWQDCYPHSLCTPWPGTTVMTTPISFTK